MTPLPFDETILRQKVVDYLRTIRDPELPVNIYDLGLIYEIRFEMQGPYLHCFVVMSLTSTACPVSEMLHSQVSSIHRFVDEVDETEVRIVFDPPWEPHMMSEEARLMLNML